MLLGRPDQTRPDQTNRLLVSQLVGGPPVIRFSWELLDRVGDDDKEEANQRQLQSCAQTLSGGWRGPRAEVGDSFTLVSLRDVGLFGSADYRGRISQAASVN